MKKLLFISICLAVLAFWACNKDKGEVKLNVFLTDAAGDYQQVNVDIREIRVKMAGSPDWVLLNTNAGIYNLLDFQNGLDALLATGTLPPDVLQEVRFVLGDDNTIMVDSVLYPLETPSAQESG